MVCKRRRKLFIFFYFRELGIVSVTVIIEEFSNPILLFRLNIAPDGWSFFLP